MKGVVGEEEARFKEDTIWILLHGVRHKRPRHSNVGWLCCRVVVVRKLVSGSPVADVISPCPPSRNESIFAAQPHRVRPHRLETERERERAVGVSGLGS